MQGLMERTSSVVRRSHCLASSTHAVRFRLPGRPLRGHSGRGAGHPPGRLGGDAQIRKIIYPQNNLLFLDGNL